MPLELTPTAAWLILVVILAPLAWFSFVIDPREYRAFKAASTGAGREGYFRRWALRGVAMYTGAPLLILALIGHLGAVAVPPAAFVSTSEQLTAPDAPLSFFADPQAPGMLVLLVCFMMVVPILVVVLMQARAPGGKMPVAGDVEPLLPRTVREGWWGAALSVNAGVGEEILFRLTLPLLLSVVTGHVLLAFAVSTILFGLVHAYQGVVGIAFTTLLGLIFAALYLGTRQLWVPMAVHALLDLRSLVFVPAVGAWMARRKSAGG